MDKEKAKIEAECWMISFIRFCVFDCCDSAREADSCEDRFNSSVDDSITITDFIKADEDLMNKYREILKGEEYEDENLTDTPCELPFKI